MPYLLKSISQELSSNYRGLKMTRQELDGKLNGMDFIRNGEDYICTYQKDFMVRIFDGEILEAGTFDNFIEIPLKAIDDIRISPEDYGMKIRISSFSGEMVSVLTVRVNA